MQPDHPEPGPAPSPAHPASPPPPPPAGPFQTGRPLQAPVPVHRAAPVEPARIIAVRVAAGFVVAGLVLNIMLDLVDAVLTPLATSTAERGAAADDPLVLASGMLALSLIGALVATGIAFITWLYIARKNLDQWRIRGLRWGPGWAIGAWILPLVNLVLPALMVYGVVRGSRTPPDQTEAPRGGSTLVWLWWLSYLLSGVGGVVFVSQDFDDSDSTASIAGYNAMSAVPDMVAAALAIVLVLRVTRSQAQRQVALDQRWAAPAAA
jgi:hypothetical protein